MPDYEHFDPDDPLFDPEDDSLWDDDRYNPYLNLWDPDVED